MSGVSYQKKPGDPRLGDLLSKSERSGGSPSFLLLGWGQDEGVARNGGRIGAAKGPECVFKRLPACGTLINLERGSDLTGASVTLGPIIRTNKTQEEGAAILEELVAKALDDGVIPIIIGGGNDQSAPNGKAFLNKFGGDQGQDAGVINLDAHLDVRPLVRKKLAHSGSPFRQLLEAFPRMKLVEFGCQGEACSAEHAKFVEDSGGSLVWLSKAQSNPKGVVGEYVKTLQTSLVDKALFVSFDIDCIASSFCPGVSAPAVRGFTADEALELSYQSGLWPQTKLLDISEYNPVIEEDRTGRLVCQIVYSFMCGVANRT